MALGVITSMHLSFVNKNPLLSLLAAHLAHREELNLVPLDHLELTDDWKHGVLVYLGWVIGFWPLKCFAIKIMMNELISML